MMGVYLIIHAIFQHILLSSGVYGYSIAISYSSCLNLPPQQQPEWMTSRRRLERVLREVIGSNIV